MKPMRITLLLSSSLLLSSCFGVTHGEFFGGHTKYLKKDSGNSVFACGGGGIIGESSRYQFWKESNLPEGTLYFLCEGDKEVLPKDCEGNSLTTPQLRRYWKKYDFPVGTKRFDCRNGVPSVPVDS